MAWEAISFPAYCGKYSGLVSGVVWSLLDPFLGMGHTYLVAWRIGCVGGAGFLHMYGGPPCMMHNETARCMQCTTTNWSDMERNIFEYPLCTLFEVTMDIECYWHIYYITPLVYRARKTFSSGLMVSRVAT